MSEKQSIMKFSVILTFILSVLKLTGYIDSSWWIVLLPVLLPIGLIVGFVLFLIFLIIWSD